MVQSRCKWCESYGAYIYYHDEEWGVPVHDDLKHFEFITLDAFQAGLSWLTILKRRDGFKVAFDNFIPAVIATYTEDKIQSLMQDTSIIRNQSKIRGTVENAKQFLRLQKEHGTFNEYIWQFTNGKTLHNHFINSNEVPAKTEASEAMSKALRKEGFKFVGPTICYAYMQASGMVNDHTTDCFRYNDLC